MIGLCKIKRVTTSQEPSHGGTRCSFSRIPFLLHVKETSPMTVMDEISACGHPGTHSLLLTMRYPVLKHSSSMDAYRSDEEYVETPFDTVVSEYLFLASCVTFKTIVKVGLNWNTFSNRELYVESELHCELMFVTPETHELGKVLAITGGCPPE